MSDVIDVLYRLRGMAGLAADDLRSAIGEAQAVLDKLDRFADDAEDGAQLMAASDLAPNSSALIPERSGLTRKEPLTPLPEHLLAEDHNADPICLCGWNPAHHRTKIGDREHGRLLVREHVRENTPTPPRTTDD